MSANQIDPEVQSGATRGKRPRRAIRMRELSAKIGYSPSSIYAMVAAKSLPAPFKLGPNASAWFEDQIDEWLEERAAKNSPLKSTPKTSPGRPRKAMAPPNKTTA
jgi:prophage regulatory protein